MTTDFVLLIGIGLLVATYFWSFWRASRVTKASPPAGIFVDTRFGPVHVIRRGSQSADNTLSPIVMFHGSQTNALDLDIDLAGRVEEGRDVLIIDRVGHGFSCFAPQAWRLEVQAQAAHDVVSALGIANPIVCGQSYGGALALRYAIDYQDEIAGLVLLAPVSHPWPGGVAWYNRVGVNPYYGWLFRRTFFALYGKYGAPKAVEKALHDTPYVSTYFARARIALTFRPKEALQNCRDIVRLYEQVYAMSRRYSELNIPTEIVAGTHDMTVITSVHGRRLAQDMQNANIDEIEHAGHAIHHTNPVECASAVFRLDERLASAQGSPLEGALRRLASVFPGTTEKG